ncbi:MAG: hypothetical protein IK990_11120 [Ruminiclostridium sp.]|nr:hypothetical protein [Ruminiclostridium sp.]
MKNGFKIAAAALAAVTAMSCTSVTAFADKLKTENGITYRVSDDGAKKTKYTGWTTSKNGTKYYYRNGVKIKNTWLKEGGKRTYYMDEKGRMTVGDAEIGGKQYFFAKNGKLVYGVDASGSSITRTGMTLSLNGVALGSDIAEVWTGDDYYIEYLTSAGVWKKQPVVSNNVPWNDSLLPFFNEGRLVERSIDIDWTDIYGELPSGDYRLCKQYSVTLTPGSQPADKMLYVPFTVKVYDDAESAWGITMKADNVTTDDLTLTISRKSGEKGTVDCTKKYVLEYWDGGGNWREVDKTARNQAVFSDLSVILGGGDSNTEQIEFYTGTLAPGHYRIRRLFSGSANGISGSLYAAAEFDINDDTPNGWGLSMSTGSDSSESGVTLRYSADSGNSREIWTTAAYTVERYENGGWEELEPADDNFAWPDKAKNVSGEVKTVLDWEKIYGLLPEGRYRIAKTFYSTSGASRKNVSRTMYAEFTINKNGVNIGKYDIAVRVTGGSKTSLRLNMIRSGEYRGALYWDGGYDIQRKTSGGKWSLYKGRSGMEKGDNGYQTLEDSMTVTLNISDVYPELTSGSYRVKLNFRDPSDHVRSFYAEFTVK